jgi:hypothetical protein
LNIPDRGTNAVTGPGTIGKYLILLGLAIIAIGILLVIAGRFPGLRIGRLPGDIYIQRDGWRFYFPLMTSILLSLILSLILWFFSRK